MMTKLRKAVDQLVQSELDLASAQHGKRFHSAHEAYAVILEEYQEAKEQLLATERVLDIFWKCCRNDKCDEIQSVEAVWWESMLAACECIQIAAMAQKAMRGYKVDKDKPDE